MPKRITLQTPRLSLLETAHVRPSIFGDVQCVAFVGWPTGEPAPCLLDVTGLLVESRGEWVLSYLGIDDESRRHGFATEVVRFYEERLGKLGACWASDSGKAFATRYIERFGPRPHWRVGVSDEVSQMFATIRGEAARA